MEIPDRAYIQLKHWNDQAFAEFTKTDAIYFTRELIVSGVELGKDLRILEIGFGNGAFAGWCRHSGFDYTGTEINPDLLACARKQGFEVVDGSESLSTLECRQHFDLIIAFDVLEHLAIDDIYVLLQRSRCLLKKKGLFVARVPSGDSPFSGFYQFGDVTHRSLLGSQAVAQLAAISGFDVVQARAPVLPLKGVGLLRYMRRSMMLLARSVVSQFIRTVFHDNQKSVITANMTIVLSVR